MTRKQQVNYSAIVTCIMGFFIPFTCSALRQFYSITSHVLFTKYYKLWNERKEGFLYIFAASAYHVILLDVENCHYLSNQAVFSTWLKSQDKNLNILRMTRAFKIK